jgi:hypothetical protein
LCGESLCSHLAQWLKVGTTALVVAMIEHGVHPGADLAMPAAVTALQTFARDTTCTATATTRAAGALSAIAIQRRYLAAAERHARADFMPPWTDIVCHEWRAILDRLAQGPAAVAATLDWAIKLRLFQRQARRHGFSWRTVTTWNRVVHGLGEALRNADQPPHTLYDDTLLGPSSPIPGAVRFWSTFLARQELEWEPLRRFLALRDELRELDLRFSQIGPRGVFGALDAAGALAHRAPGVDDIPAAVDQPPPEGRAHVRGQAIQLLAKSRVAAAADWSRVNDFTGHRQLDLSDPFARRMEWIAAPAQDALDPLERMLSRASVLAARYSR